MGRLLMGYDIETKNPEGTRAFVDAVLALHREVDYPFTLYCVGQTVELQPDYFARLDRDPLVDIESHTYSHVRLKTVYAMGPRGAAAHKGQRLFPGGTLEQLDQEIGRANAIIEPLIGRKVEGLTGPWGYYRGLCDRPDILALCAKHGLKFLRTWARDDLDGNPTPYQDPFFYEDHGHPDMLELLAHGYQDDFYYRAYCPDPHPQGFAGYLIDLARRIEEQDLTWSACSHDHVKNAADLEAKLSWLRPFLRAAKAAGVEGLDGRTFYQRHVGQRTAHAKAATAASAAS